MSNTRNHSEWSSGKEKSHGADGAGFDSCYETYLFSFFFFFVVG